MMKKNLDYYMSLPYGVDIIPESDKSGFTAYIPDLPGCVTSAENIDKLWEMLEEAKELWLEIALKDEEFIPEPSPIKDEFFSGKFVTRIPKSLHRQLSLRADRESTSLNQLIVMILSEGMGRWSASHTQIREYSKFLRDYTTYAQFNLSSILNKFESLYKKTQLEEEPIAWDIENLSLKVKDKSRIINHG